MDPLTQLLVQRAMTANTATQPQTLPQGPEPSVPTGLPAVPPSGGRTHTPPEAKRFANAQAMMNAYRNNWTPNPLLLQASSR